ncbi:MAG: hypothetical protein IPN38_18995 [Flavobacteriales bacterium]|nr:hypothetical protein [Flavobacteriales bacterium]
MVPRIAETDAYRFATKWTTCPVRTDEKLDQEAHRRHPEARLVDAKAIAAAKFKVVVDAVNSVGGGCAAAAGGPGRGNREAVL